MPSTYDSLLRLELQATGENATTWGTKTNNNLELIAAAIAGQTTLTLSSANVSLTEANAATDQARSAILVLGGTLINDVNIVVPAQSKTYAILRQTSGAFNITVKNPTGTGAVLPASGTEIVVCTTATCVGLVGSLTANVSALDTRVAAVSASVSALNVRVADVSASVSALNVQVANVSAQVSALQVQVANVSALTSALDVRLTAVSASVSAINVQLAAVSAVVSSLNSLDIRIIE